MRANVAIFIDENKRKNCAFLKYNAHSMKINLTTFLPYEVKKALK